MRRLLFALLLVAGCSGYRLARPDTPPVDAFGTPPPPTGEVCVLRPHVVARGDVFVVRDNDTLVGATRGLSYFCYFAAPGRHLVTSESDRVEKTELDVVSGRRYYLQQAVDAARTQLLWLDEGTATRLLGSLAYAVLVAVPRDEALPPAASTVRSIARR